MAERKSNFNYTGQEFGEIIAALYQAGEELINEIGEPTEYLEIINQLYILNWAEAHIQTLSSIYSVGNLIRTNIN